MDVQPDKAPKKWRPLLLAGGGTGGHIAPNLAVIERMRANGASIPPHFLVSDRQVDAHMLEKEGMPFTALPARPLRLRPRAIVDFYRGFRDSEARVLSVIERLNPGAMLATGGFVSGPAVSAASKAGLPVALVSLDAIPGRANRLMARRATDVFTVYATDRLPRAQEIGMPLRLSARSGLSDAKARWDLGLRPDHDTLLVIGGSQGAQSLNQMMAEVCTRAKARRAFEGWQIIHLAGNSDVETLRAAYKQAGIEARVEAFCNQMGLIWAAASLAIARAGASTVAEAWAAAVPAIFMPYPYHKDQHQRFNAEPLVNAGAALLLRDRIDPIENASELMGPLFDLMANDERRVKMRQILRQTAPEDGALTLARWVMGVTGMAVK